jgi:hypothetical protein
MMLSLLTAGSGLLVGLMSAVLVLPIFGADLENSENLSKVWCACVCVSQAKLQCSNGKTGQSARAAEKDDLALNIFWDGITR